MCVNLLQALMESERVEEAVELAEHSGAVGMSQEQYQHLCRTLLQRAGFVKLAHAEFSQAQEYFSRGAVDIREAGGSVAFSHVKLGFINTYLFFLATCYSL